MQEQKISQAPTSAGKLPSIRNLSRMVSKSLSFRKRTTPGKNKGAVDDTSTIGDESTADDCYSVEEHKTTKILRPDLLLTGDETNMVKRCEGRENEARDTKPRNHSIKFTFEDKVISDDTSTADDESSVGGCSSVGIDTTISGNSNVEK